MQRRKSRARARSASLSAREKRRTSTTALCAAAAALRAAAEREREVRVAWERQSEAVLGANRADLELLTKLWRRAAAVRGGPAAHRPAVYARQTGRGSIYSAWVAIEASSGGAGAGERASRGPRRSAQLSARACINKRPHLTRTNTYPSRE
jgi:hypothetical protein